MVTLDIDTIPKVKLTRRQGYRFIPSKYPPINLFDDVADADEFDTLYELQALTNPRLLNTAGDLNLLPRNEIPFGITGCSYAVAPFTHVNPNGSRFSDGKFGVLYIADTLQTALKEVTYHQEKYWKNVQGLKYDTFTLRGLSCYFSGTLHDLMQIPTTDPIYDATSYTQSHLVGIALKKAQSEGIQYRSVRNSETQAICWGLFTPLYVHSIQQTQHMELVWCDGQVQKILEAPRVIQG